MISKIQFNGGGGLQAYISFKIRRSGEEWSYHVEHLGKSRLRIVRGSGHARGFICAKAQAGRNGYLEADRPNAAGLSALDSMSLDPSGMGNASR
jgi:hypothetical protein